MTPVLEADQVEADAPATAEIASDRPSDAERVMAVVKNPRVLALIDQAVVSGTNFLTAWALMRLVDETSLGIYTLAMTVVIVGVGMQTELVSNPFKIYGQRRSGNSLRRYTGSAVAHQAVASISLLLMLLALAWATNNIALIVPVLPVLLVFGPMIMTREFVRQMSFARFRFDEALLSDVVVSGLQLASLAALWATDMLSPAAVLATFGTACGASVVIWLVRSRDRMIFDRRVIGRHALRNWRFSRWTLATYLIGSTTPFVMPWVLAAYHGQGATGLLAACNTLIGLSYTFTTGVANWLTAGAAREYHKAGKAGLLRVVRSTSLIMFAGLGPFVALTWFFGEWALMTVYKDADVVGLGPVSFVIACGVLSTAVNIVAGNALWAIDRPQDGLIADACVLLSTVVLAVLLVPTYAIMGAAIATAAGVTVGGVVRSLSLVLALRKSPGAVR